MPTRTKTVRPPEQGDVPYHGAVYLLNYLAARGLSWMLARIPATAPGQWTLLRSWVRRLENGETPEEAMQDREEETPESA